MNQKDIKQEDFPSTSDVNGDDDEWEDMTMVVTVNGILDTDLVREAVQKGLVKVRYAETDSPVVQLNNSLYTGTWVDDLETNIVLQSNGKDQLEVISCTTTMLEAEKALLTSSKKGKEDSEVGEILPGSITKSNKL